MFIGLLGGRFMSKTDIPIRIAAAVRSNVDSTVYWAVYSVIRRKIYE